jgi:hypothetical protein
VGKRPLSKRKRSASLPQQQQQYDNVLKSLIEGREQEVLPNFLEGATFLEVVNIEVLRTPLRVDKVYKVWYRDAKHILHLEFESGSDNKIGYRLLSYHTYYLEQFEIPIITVVVYPFPVKEAGSPFREISGDEEILKFHFRTMCLWKLSASTYVREHIIGMYALLPTMQDASQDLLLQSIEEMITYYAGDNTQLAQQLKWLGVLLRRSELVPVKDKAVVQERLNMWNNLLDEDPYLQSRIAQAAEKAAEKAAKQGLQQGLQQGLEKGRAEGEAEGALNASRQLVLELVEARFPGLKSFAEQRVLKMRKPESLRRLIGQIAVAPDEETARRTLSPHGT